MAASQAFMRAFSKSIYPWIHSFMALSAWGVKYIHRLTPNESITKQKSEPEMVGWAVDITAETMGGIFMQRDSSYSRFPADSRQDSSLYAVIKQIYYTPARPVHAPILSGLCLFSAWGSWENWLRNSPCKVAAPSPLTLRHRASECGAGICMGFFFPPAAPETLSVHAANKNHQHLHSH